MTRAGRSAVRLLAVASLAACERPPEADPSPAPPSPAGPEEPPPAATSLAERFGAAPLAPEARLLGFAGHSRIEFSQEGAAIHEMWFAFQPPERARVELGLAKAPLVPRAREYRMGPAVHVRPSGIEPSTAIEGTDREILVRRFELRRAAFQWPDGFAWSGTFEAEGSVAAPLLEGEDRIGTVRAGLDAEGRPRWFAVDDRDGAESERLEVFAWGETFGRAHPTELAMIAMETVAYREVVLHMDFRARRADAFFVPVDRVDRQPAVVHEPIGRRVTLSLEDRPPEEDRADLEAWIEVDERLRGFRAPVDTLDAHATLRLDPGGEPIELFWSYALPPPEDPGAGRTPEGASVEGFDRVVAVRWKSGLGRTELLELLRSHLPEGAIAGAPYLRLDGPTTRLGGSLVLPYRPLEPR